MVQIVASEEPTQIFGYHNDGSWSWYNVTHPSKRDEKDIISELNRVFYDDKKFVTGLIVENDIDWKMPDSNITHSGWMNERLNALGYDKDAILSNDISNSIELLEMIAFDAGSDKSKDDHKYVDFYAMLFDPIRLQTTTVMELGIEDGQSMVLWNEYFPHAQIIGVDIKSKLHIQQWLDRFPRVTTKYIDCYRTSGVSKLNLTEAGYDIIIDDAMHTLKYQETALEIWWKYVKPGELSHIISL